MFVKVLKKVDVKSFAKFNLYYMGIIGLAVGLATGIPMLYIGVRSGHMGIAWLAALVGLTLFYALMGLLFGYAGGALINFILKLSDGVKFEMEDGETEAKVIK